MSEDEERQRAEHWKQVYGGAAADRATAEAEADALRSQLATCQAALEQERARAERAEAEAAEYGSKAQCYGCGTRLPWNEMAYHIAACEKHPLSILVAARKQAEAERRVVEAAKRWRAPVDGDGLAECDELEAAVDALARLEGEQGAE